MPAVYMCDMLYLLRSRTPLLIQKTIFRQSKLLAHRYTVYTLIYTQSTHFVHSLHILIGIHR